MADYLELLPAVDIAGGQAVQLVQGVAGSGEAVRRPGRGRAALAGGRRGVDPPRRPRRGLRPRPQPRAAGRDRRHARHPGRDERRHPRRRVAGGRDGDRLPPGQHRHRRARAAGVVRRGDRRVRRPGRRSGSTSAAAPWPRAAGPARAATSTRCWPGSTPRAAPATSSPTSTRTACSRARTSQLLRDVCAATDRPVVASRRHHRARRPRGAAWAWSPTGVEGAIVGTALYEGRFTLEDALALTRPAGGAS